MSVEELIERLRSHMGRQEVPILLKDCRLAADKLEELAAENEGLQRRLELTQDTDSKMKLLLDQEDQIIRQEAALAEKDKEIAALREALEQVYADAVSIGRGENSISDKARGMVEAALDHNAGCNDANE